MRVSRVLLAILAAFLCACPFTKADTAASPTAMFGATALPPLVSAVNEVEISANLAYADPTWVLGALVNRQTGEVYGLNSYLSATAKPVVTQISDVIFDDLLSQSLDVSGSYLAFLKADITRSSTDEVSVIKTSKALIAPRDVDRAAVTAFLSSLPADQRSQIDLVEGFVDVTVTASYLTDSGTTASASGFGAAIQGKWYAKSKNLRVQHCLVALVTSAVFATTPSDTARANKSLDRLTQEALNSGTLTVDSVRVVQPLKGPPK